MVLRLAGEYEGLHGALREMAENDREAGLENSASNADEAADAIKDLSGGFRPGLSAAAGQAAVAIEALLRAHRENEPVDAETLEKLLDAAKMLIEAELLARDPAVEQVYIEVCDFLEGWA